MRITEQWILAHAPGPSVAEDGRRISEAGRFLARSRTEDALTCWGTCAGSARNPYYVSIDWALSEKEPVYSCSCPSRHFPCKHALALLYDVLSEKPFDVETPPAYVLRARARQAREAALSAARLERARKQDAAAKQKRVERQLEGLAKAEKLSDELLRSGIGTLPDLPAQTMERLAAELGNCALPGARGILERVALLGRKSRRSDENARRRNEDVLRELIALRALITKARGFLNEQLSSGSYALESPLLFEALGGVWSNDELRELDSYRKSARLVQLSFDTVYDEAKRERAERGFWLELTRGDVVHTARAQAPRTPDCAGDSFFGLLEVPVLYEAPVAPCPRVWWDSAASLELTDGDRAEALGFAAPRIANALERAARPLSDPLLPDYVPALIAFGSIGHTDGGFVLEDPFGGRIALRDRREDGPELASSQRLTALPELSGSGGALFGLLYYDGGSRRFCLHPYSLVTATEIFRLQY